MDKYEILETIKDKMENGDDQINDAFSFLDWLQDFIYKQLNKD